MMNETEHQVINKSLHAIIDQDDNAVELKLVDLPYFCLGRDHALNDIVTHTFEHFLEKVEINMNAKSVKLLNKFASLYVNFYSYMCRDIDFTAIGISRSSRLTCSHHLIDKGLILPIFNKIKYIKFSKLVEEYKKDNCTRYEPTIKALWRTINEECNVNNKTDSIFLAALIDWFNMMYC